MTTVFELSTDNDIRNTQLHSNWGPVLARYAWDQIHPCHLNLAGAITLVVVAHGNGCEIGNEDPDTIDIDESVFLALVQGNMANNAIPTSIYISTCGLGIAEFSARVRLAAQQNEIWHGTQIFGHSDAVAGEVPPPGDIRWVQIFA
ncbi:hypothetical protein MA04_01386 [Alcanivorax balearicus MACL04]|uniref:Uncharacterized protein n=1 Tax=Alloalcanivorax balearicus MACL04 TaxID=1177182 RepID=A0ABT2QX36_9GAMM|nr:hypothetical protein [Alloalcanivorax balearicus]MCU5782086.1 hypothetical protein [Alloalcanivorax balearicus MACL04]